MDRVTVEIVDAAFTEFEGEVVSGDGEKVALRVSAFGRDMPVKARCDQTAHSKGAEHRAPSEVVARSRNRAAPGRSPC